MNGKTIATAIIGTIAGLTLAMGTVAYAQNTDHMGNSQTSTSMMGETTPSGHHGQATRDTDTMHGNTVQKSTHGSMHAQTQQPVTGHHTGTSQATSNYPCHADSGSKTTTKS